MLLSWLLPDVLRLCVEQLALHRTSDFGDQVTICNLDLQSPFLEHCIALHSVMQASLLFCSGAFSGLGWLSR